MFLPFLLVYTMNFYMDGVLLLYEHYPACCCTICCVETPFVNWHQTTVDLVGLQNIPRSV